jgi:hypothetical protein
MRLESVFQANKRREDGAWMDSRAVPGMRLRVRGLGSAAHDAAIKEFWDAATEEHRKLPDINDQAQRFVIRKALLVGWNLEDEFTEENVKAASDAKLFRDEVVELAGEVSARGREVLETETGN